MECLVLVAGVYLYQAIWFEAFAVESGKAQLARMLVGQQEQAVSFKPFPFRRYGCYQSF